jgi:hypothetical protein
MDVLRSTHDSTLADPLDVVLTLVPALKDGEVVSVEGSVRLEAASPRTFSGWLELLQVLEELVETSR